MKLGSRRILLSSVEIRNDDTFVYHYSTGSFMHRFLSGDPLWVKYEGSVRDIPPEIAVIPFIGLISQIIWFYDGTLDVAVLDATYAESMNNVKAVFQSMYPKVNVSGRVNIEKKVSSPPKDYPRKAAFFTGGIDSLATALRHRQEDPLLISIWGSEARVNQETAWQKVNTAQIAAAREMALQRTVIASNYLDVLRQPNLAFYFPGKLQRSWYVEVAYGCIFLGLSAPLAWREGVGTVYIASSFTAEQPPDGSYPALVENTAWAGTQVLYDGVDEKRQAKLERIVTEIRGPFPGLKLNVCTLGKDEGNCSQCEKCSRTIAGLALLGIDPARHGFFVAEDTPDTIRQALEHNEWQEFYVWQLSSVKFWRELQKKIPSYRTIALPQWRDFFDWLSEYDINKFLRKHPRSRVNELKRFVKTLFRLPVGLAVQRLKNNLKLKIF